MDSSAGKRARRISRSSLRQSWTGRTRLFHDFIPPPFQKGFFPVKPVPGGFKEARPPFRAPIAKGMVAGAAGKEMEPSTWCIVGRTGPGRNMHAPLRATFCRKSWKRGAWAGSASCCNTAVPYEGTRPTQGVEIYPVSSLREAWHLLTSDLPCRLHLQVQGGAHAPRDKTPLWFLGGKSKRRPALCTPRHGDCSGRGGRNILLCGSRGRQIHTGARIQPFFASKVGGSVGRPVKSTPYAVSAGNRGTAWWTSVRSGLPPHHFRCRADEGRCEYHAGEVSPSLHSGVLFSRWVPGFPPLPLWKPCGSRWRLGQVVISRFRHYCDISVPFRILAAALRSVSPAVIWGDRRKSLHLPPAQIARYRRKNFRPAVGPV